MPTFSWIDEVPADARVKDFVLHFSNDKVSWGGAASPAVLQQIQFHPPIVSQDEDKGVISFSIDRMIIAGQLNQEAKAIEITERVDEDGRYQLIAKKPIDSGNHHWMLAPALLDN